MAFFDDLSRKITNAGQTAAQKAQELAAVAKLNSEISDEEKKINNAYFQIGKLYVAMHENDYEPDFEGMIASLKDSKQKILEHKQQIQNIKGVAKCEKCGADVPVNVAFCSSCGAPMSRQSASADNGNTVKCANCGAMIPANMRFCTSCGKPMNAQTQNAPAPEEVKDDATNVQAQSVAPSIEETTENPSANTKKCPNCGAEISSENTFCTECGTKLE